MNNNKSAIGVFDSGMGGLTVLRSLKARLPYESFIYLGDMARVPYGTKSRDTVKQYAIQMARILVEREIKALVIACNTATTAALPYLQAMWPDIPVLGVVAPGALAASSATKNDKIFVMATETTIASGAYQETIQSHRPESRVQGRVCSLLVALAEEGMVNNDIAKAALSHYLSELKEEDTLLLGCTHFPVFKPLLMQLLPSHVQLVDSGEATASALIAMLEAHALATDFLVPGHTKYLVTDSVARFARVGEVFLSETLSSDCIELVDVAFHDSVALKDTYREVNAAVNEVFEITISDGSEN